MANTSKWLWLKEHECNMIGLFVDHRSSQWREKSRRGLHMFLTRKHWGSVLHANKIK
jgi:hypothetical protein